MLQLQLQIIALLKSTFLDSGWYCTALLARHAMPKNARIASTHLVVVVAVVVVLKMSERRSKDLYNFS